MKIIIDAMGGDNAPAEIVKGALLAQKEFGVDVVLVGREAEVIACLADEGVSLPRAGIELRNATEVVEMEDDPATVTRRKKDSSMTVALNMLRDGEGDAVVSAGSTGALLTGATLLVKRVRGIRRAAMAPALPNNGNGVLLMDCGANVECTPEYLLQFAYMGSFYARSIMGYEKPRVGLLNVGVEESKGGELQKQAYALLKQAGEEGRINFIGNVEARELLSGDVDVLVTDGFSGNILLKGVEGTIKFLMHSFKDIFSSSLKNKLAAAVVYGDMRQLKHRMDVNEVGGTALLGISKPVIKAHGSSDARAIRSAVRQAIRFIEADVVGEITENVEYMRLKEEKDS